MASIVVAGDTSGSITLAAPAIAGSNTLTLPTQTATLATLTTPSFASTIGVGGATAAANGAGITFPATQSASTDANTLDDYEEGTWLPTVTSGITSPTYLNQSATYTKIGRFVTFGFQLTVNGGTRNTNILNISLPFTPAAAGTNRAYGGIWTYSDSSTLGSLTTNVPFVYIANGNSSIQFYNAAGGTFVGTDLSTATPNFYISGSFITE